MYKVFYKVLLLNLFTFYLIFQLEMVVFAQEVHSDSSLIKSNLTNPDSGLTIKGDTNSINNSLRTDAVKNSSTPDATSSPVSTSRDSSTNPTIVPKADTTQPPATSEVSNNAVVQPGSGSTLPGNNTMPAVIEGVAVANDTAAKNIYQAVKINEQMIDAFNKFLEQNYPGDYERYVVDYSSINFSDLQSLKKAWYQHLYDDKYYIALGQDSVVGSTLAADTSIVSDTTKHQAEPVEFIAQQSPGNESPLKKQTKNKKKISTYTQKTINEKNINEQSNNEKLIYQKNINQKNINQKSINQKSINEKSLNSTFSHGLVIPDTALAKGFVFTVQILACRTQVTKNELKRVYSGDLNVTERFEDNWYKYTIGTYNSFMVARKLRMICGSNGAFVAAYLNGVRINPREALVKPDSSTTENIITVQPGLMTYKVQLAACRYEMADTSLIKIYSNTAELQKIFENNWYKYVIDCGSDLEKARETLRNSGVQGAFIALYKDNVRIKKIN